MSCEDALSPERTESGGASPKPSMNGWIKSVLLTYRRPLAFIVIMQLVCGLLMALQPRYYQEIVSLAIKEVHGGLWAAGLPLLGWLALIYLGIAVLQGMSGYLGSVFSSNLLRRLQTDFFHKTSHLPLAYFQHQSAGEFFTSFSNDIGQAQRFFADFVPGVAREFITATAVTIILFSFCPASLTLAALCIVILVALLVTILNRIMGGFARAQRAGWSEIHRVFDEAVQGIDTLKVLAAEKGSSAHFQMHTGVLRELSIRAGVILSVFSPGVELTARLGGLGLVALAFYLIAKGDIGVEPFLLFFFYATLLQISVSNLTKSIATVQTEFTGLRHLAAFFAEKPEPEENDLETDLPPHPVTIELCGVTFGYPGGRRLYNKASLVIPSNSTTLIHGRSGSGKSTLINLLLRFYEPKEGTISLDGKDIRLIRRAELRKKIGVITQNHFIFQETLRGNIQIAKPEADDFKILKALELAQLSDFLARMPHGLDTVMDPRGKGMSAGEKQRICIARVLLRESPVMILDEPWSNLDENAREALAEVLNSSKRKATILILSHEHFQALAIDRVYHLDGERGVFLQENF